MTRFLSTFVLLYLALLSRHGETAPVYDASETNVQGTEDNSNAVPTTVLSSLTTGETAPAENGEGTTILEPRKLKDKPAAKSVTAGFGTRKPGLLGGLTKMRQPTLRQVPAYDVRKKGAPVIEESDDDSSPPESPMPRPLKRGLPRDATPPVTESDEDSSDPESDYEEDEDEDEDEELESQGESPKREVPRAGPPKTRLPTRLSPRIEESDYDSKEEESPRYTTPKTGQPTWPPKTGPSGYGPQTRFPRARDSVGDRTPYSGPGKRKIGSDYDEPSQKRQRQDTRVPRSPYRGEGMWHDGKGLPKETVSYGDFGGLNMYHAHNYGNTGHDFDFLKDLPAKTRRFFDGI